MPPKQEVGRSAYAGVVAGTHSSPVASQQIWSEHVEKELKYQTIRHEYTRNPQTVPMVTEKPTALSRTLALRTDRQAEEERTAQMRTLKTKDPHAYEYVVGAIERRETDPQKKYPFPQTTSQEIGWDQDYVMRHRAESSQFTVPHTNNDVTAFADRYVLTHAFNPFSNKQFKHNSKTTPIKH